MSASPNRESAARVGLGFALILSQPVRALRRRVNSWIATRTPRLPGPWNVDRRRVYIVPTRYGYTYGALLLVMLLGAMNYSNSMAFALTFLLAGMGLLAMHHTHGNLVNVRLRALRISPVFAGETAHFTIELENPSPKPRYALALAWQDVPAHGHVDLSDTTTGSLSLGLPTTTRGWLPAPRFSVETEFPVGLFHAWTWVELDMACLVYPKPAPAGLRPPDTGGGNGTRTGIRSGQEEFAGLRPYQRGDTPRMIHWKSLPKHRSPMVKQFAETLENERWLDWSALPSGWGTEQRLSQLTRWVIDSDASGQPYGLKLPGSFRPPATGDLHRQHCLTALALFDGSPG